MQNTPTTQNFCNRKLWYDMKKKTDEQRQKKRNIFSVVCFSFFFQCSSHSLSGPVLCVCTLVWKYQYQSKYCVRSRSLLAIIIRLADFYTCVCVSVCLFCSENVRASWTRRRIYVYTFMHMHVCVCIYAYLYMYMCAGRATNVSVCTFFNANVCVHVVCVFVCCDVLAKNQPTYWSNRSGVLVRTRKSFESFSCCCCCGCLVGLILCSVSSGAPLCVCVYSPLVFGAKSNRTFICIMGPPVECGSKINTKVIVFIFFLWNIPIFRVALRPNGAINIYRLIYQTNWVFVQF